MSLPFIKPMQPTLVEEPPAGDGWLHEIKYDGYRTQLAIHNGSVTAITRNGHDWTDRYPTIVGDAVGIACSSAIIDGECCVQNAEGVTDFSALQRAIRTEPHRLIFFAFDLMHLDGTDLRRSPIEERRSRLSGILPQPASRIVFSEEYDGEGRVLFEYACEMGLEGIVSKRKRSSYTSGDTRAWLKTKCWIIGVFDVIGVTRDKKGIPYALLADESGYYGSAILSLPATVKNTFWRYVDANARSEPRVAGAPRKDATWLQPGLRASVRYLKGGGKLRHAVVRELEVSTGR